MTAVLLDKNKVRASFSRAALSYDQAATLQRQVGMRLLALIDETADPGNVVDIGCGTGFLTAHLVNQPAFSQVLALDLALPMLGVTRATLGKRCAGYICADAESLPLKTASVARLYSNLALQWCQNLEPLLQDFYRVLTPTGKLLFSTFGPATLNELKQAWSAVDGFTHVNDFYSLTDIEYWLKNTGFKAAQCDSEIHQSSYDTVLDLMHELKSIGAHNVAHGRSRQMTTRRQMMQMIEAYPLNSDGRVMASYEVFYVQAEK